MMNYYEILGVSRGAEAPEITQVYRRLLQEQYQEMGKEADLSTLSQAHKTLTNSAKRRDYDSRLDLLSGQFKVEDPEKPTKAEKAYLDGHKAFDLQNYQEAVQYFARAARLNPGQGHYFSQWGLSIGMFPGRLPEAELYCKKAIELDPDNPVFYFNLGFLYQRHNLSEAAQQSFVKAQEAQQVRYAKHSAQDSATIAVPWRGDADSLLKELDSIEQSIGQSDGEQPSVIALPQAEEAAPEKTAEEQQPPVPETAPEQIPAVTEETSDHSGIDDLLSELDSLESSMEKVETFHNGKTPAAVEPEESRLETFTAREEAVSQEPEEQRTTSTDTYAPVPDQLQESELEIVTPQQELISKAREDQAHAHELQREVESLNESPLDLLKELDSIESMVAGIEQAGAEAPPENIQDSPQQQEGSRSSGLPVVSEKDVLGSSAKEMEHEALKLRQEPDVPLDEPSPEHPQSKQRKKRLSLFPLSGRSLKKKPPNEAEIIKEKMEKLNQMEEQMMDDLLKLKAERERLKADLEV